MSLDDPFIELCDALRDAHWRLDAACKEHPHLAWFPDRGADVREQLQVCGRCLVRTECLEHALAHNEAVGVWGGHSQRSLRNLRRLRALLRRTDGSNRPATELEQLAASDHPSRKEPHHAAA